MMQSFLGGDAVFSGESVMGAAYWSSFDRISYFVYCLIGSAIRDNESHALRACTDIRGREENENAAE